jgi:photosystem II stability/assembly factor-like uncharacterized protein
MRLRILGPILVLTLVSIVIVGSMFVNRSNHFKQPDISKVRQLPNETQKVQTEYQEASGAAEYFRLKRLPSGKSKIPVTRYMEALEHVKHMPKYASSSGEFATEDTDPLVAQLVGLSTWVPLGPGNIGGRTRAFIIHPQSTNIMYAAGVTGGIWKTTDSGGSWQPLADLLPSLSVCALAMDPKNPNVIYAGTGESYQGFIGVGIFKSTDGGTSWQHLTNTFNSNFFQVNDLVISPHDSQRVYAATRNGVWQTTDGGDSWIQAFNTPEDSNCSDLAIRTDQATDYIFASFYGFQVPHSVYRNTDAGSIGSWAPVLMAADASRTSLAIAPSDQNIIYASIARVGYNDVLGIYKSTDSGNTWTAQVRYTDTNRLNTLLLSDPYSGLCGNPDRGQGGYDNVIAVDPLDPNQVWVGGIGLFRSNDGGKNWGVCVSLHLDQHAIVFHPQYNGTTNTTLFVGNDGGLYKTDNALAVIGGDPCGRGSSCKLKWESLNNNYAVTQFYYGLPYPDGKTYIGGSQDNGTTRGTDLDGANSWKPIYGGDGGYVAIDPTNTNTLYVETQRLGIYKSTNGGRDFKSVTTGIDDSGLFIRPLVMDQSNPRILWSGGASLWRTTDGAASWVKASPPVSNSVSAIAVHPKDSNLVLVGSAFGSILQTQAALNANPATSWHSVTPQTGFVSGVTYDPNNSSVAYATYSSFHSSSAHSHIYKSVDGGQSWFGIDGVGDTGIPDIPVHCLVVDPSDSLRLYVGTDLGVFVSLDGGNTWAQENTGFANVITESLATSTTDGITRLFAFTHGRGVWRVRLAAYASKITSVSVSGKKLIITGQHFDEDAIILINGEEQKTINDVDNKNTILIAKKAGKKVRLGDKLQIRNADKSLSNEFIFTNTK